MNPRSGRLLLVVPSATSFLAFLRGLAREWRVRGGTVAVAAGPDLPGAGPAPWPDGVERLAMPATRLGSPLDIVRGVATLRHRVLDWQPDIVHSHFTMSAVVAAATRRIVGDAGAAWLATFHGMHLTANRTLASRVMAEAEVWAARRMSLVCVLNREDRVALEKRVPGVRVHHHESFGVGCDLRTFDPERFSAADRVSIRDRLGIPARAFVAAYVGRQAAFKGFPVAMQGFLAARRAGFDGWLIVVGEPDAAHQSGLRSDELEALARDGRAMMTGWQRDVAPYLAASDVLLLPSVREGMPVVAMEALSLGTPVITVDSRGCRDVVRNGVDGFVVPAADPRAFARKLVECAGDPDLMDRLRKAAIAGRARFDGRVYDQEQVELYLSLLERRQGITGRHLPSDP
jgi:glycosyltransferase involved in cell wall biosynthesis